MKLKHVTKIGCQRLEVVIFVHCHLECDHVLLSPRRFPALSREGGRHGPVTNTNTHQLQCIFLLDFQPSYKPMFSRHLSNSFTSNTPSPLPGLKRHVTKGNSDCHTFLNAATWNPKFWIQAAVGTLELFQLSKWQKHQQHNQQNLHMSFAPIEKRILQKLEALDPSSHWRHARSASLLDFAAAKPSNNRLVAHVRGQSLAPKRNLLRQRREGRP